jgi:hypothetical protein
MVYEKCNIGIDKDTIMKEMAFCGKENTDYPPCLKNKLHFLAASIHKMNF